ncbi:unnamed protein product [Clonostachys rhizophaga]|uniref:Uncharacterized protein n=1 Tax=Clonostachys rhizophaga TaxID=160324 RepID=A0A9N9YJK1_9HYPO|nr:unnamed protein product [Clonostachys rhizophaga]
MVAEDAEDFFIDGNANFDLSVDDGAQARQFFLSRNDYFAEWPTEFNEIIVSCKHGFRKWPILYLPPETLVWKQDFKVTLIVLAEKLQEHGTGPSLDSAVEEYEKDMFKRGRDLIERSMGSGELLFANDAPNTLEHSCPGQ